MSDAGHAAASAWGRFVDGLLCRGEITALQAQAVRRSRSTTAAVKIADNP